METTVEITLTLTCTVRAEKERCDYGVRGSPVWYEINPDTVSVEGIDIEGTGVSLSDLPKDFRDVIVDMAIEAALNKDEWDE